MLRRDVLTGLGALALAGAARPGLASPQPLVPAGEAAREAIERVFPGLHAERRGEINLSAPEITDNGAFVPISLHAELPRVDRVLVLAPDNPRPLVAVLRPGQRFAGPIALRIKLARSQEVHVLASAGDRLYGNSRLVRITTSGCGSDSEDARKPPGAIRFKLDPPVQGRANARFLIQHPMLVERSDAQEGHARPAHFIEEIRVAIDGEPLLTMECGSAVSANPLVSFTIATPRAGETLTVRWRDNRGLSGESPFAFA